jgi:high-affinity Fe2+/Pb2+ permease
MSPRAVRPREIVAPFEQGLETPSQEVSIRLADHPRARRQIDLARGWGGVGAFALVGLLALHSGLSPAVAGLRALLAGVVTYMVCWGLAVTVWRHLAVAEEAAARVHAEQRRISLLAEIERRAAALSDHEDDRR